MALKIQHQLKQGLEKLGHTVYIIAVSNSSAPADEKNVLRIKSFPFVFMKERRIGITLITRCMKIIADLNLDVIHTQTEFSIGTLGRKAAKDLNIPLIHTYHTIYEQYTHC